MSFYNRLAAVVVQKFVDFQGKVEPLDVVSYGGSSSISASIISGGTTTVLPAPSAGFAYALHSWGANLGQGLAANGGAGIVETAGTIDATGHSATNTIAGFGRQLNGQLATSAVSITNITGVTMTFFLRYDLIVAPAIQ